MKAAPLRSVIEETLSVTNKSIVVGIGVDNSSAMTLAISSTYSRRIRYIELRRKYVREQVKKKNIQLHKVYKDDNTADHLTKAAIAYMIQHLM